MHTIQIYRKGLLLVGVAPDDSSTQSKTAMGENVLNVSFTLNFYADITVGDYTTVFGEVYKINDLPACTKQADKRYEYTVKFTAESGDLVKAQLFFLDNLNNFTESSFSLMGTAATFVDLIVKNANRVQPGEWSVGQVLVTGYKNITFDKSDCLSALSKLADEFSTEFWVIGKTVHLTKIRRDTGYTFKQGRYKGLYEVNRTSLNNASVITRLYAFGSDKNIPPNYNFTRLRLPGGYSPCLISNLSISVVNNGNGTQTFTFSFTPATGTGINAITIQARYISPASGPGPWTDYTAGNTSGRTLTDHLGDFEFRFIVHGGACDGITSQIVQGPTTTPQFVYTPIPFLEKNVAIYGLIEYTQYFDDIFPHRTGIVSSVNATNPFTFIDSAIDFDVNNYLIPGASAKVTFNTGQLSGYTFDVKSFDNTTKEFTLLKNKDERSIDIPSASLHPEIGDEYVLVDIQMPSTYVIAAENELLQKAQELLNSISVPQVAYSVVIDPVFMKTHGWKLFLGDEVWLKDEPLGIDKKIRITQIVRNIVQENSYQITLSDTVSTGTIAQLIATGSNNSTNIQSLNNTVQYNAVFNNTFIGDVRVQDGTQIIKDMPTTAGGAGFSEVLIEDITGKLYRKV